MKRILITAIITGLAIGAFTAAAIAGPMGAIAGWLTNTVLLAAIPIILGIGVIAIWTDWICLLLVSAGGLLTTVGLAFADKKLSKAEIAEIKAKFADLRAAIKNLPRHR